MKLINLGNSGVMGSAIALGSGISKNGIDEGARVFKSAIEYGINFFDNADIYGNGESEIRFGEIWKKSGVTRENFLIQILPKLGFVTFIS